MGAAAQKAYRYLSNLGQTHKNGALCAVAGALTAHTASILEANTADIKNACEKA